MAQILVPINTGVVASPFVAWTPVGAATLHECMDEGIAGDGDTTYGLVANTASIGGATQVWYGNVTAAFTPVSGAIKYKMRWRERAPGVTSTIGLFSIGSTAQGIVESTVFSDTSSTYKDTIITMTDPTLLGDFGNLALRMSVSSCVAAQFRVTAFEIELPDPAPGLKGWYYPMWRWA